MAPGTGNHKGCPYDYSVCNVHGPATTQTPWPIFIAISHAGCHSGTMEYENVCFGLRSRSGAYFQGWNDRLCPNFVKVDCTRESSHQHLVPRTQHTGDPAKRVLPPRHIHFMNDLQPRHRQIVVHHVEYARHPRRLRCAGYPPVAMTFDPPPNSRSNRVTIPLTISEYPRTSPDCSAWMVLRPIAVEGRSNST